MQHSLWIPFANFSASQTLSDNLIRHTRKYLKYELKLSPLKEKMAVIYYYIRLLMYFNFHVFACIRIEKNEMKRNINQTSM